MGEATHSNLPAFNFKQAITHMVQRNGSDLLLKVGRPATIRVNGDLVPLETAPLKPEELKSLAEQIMTPRQVKECAEHKEADFAIGVPGVGRFRTNVYQQRGTVAFAFRAIPYEVKQIRELNLPGVLEEIALKPRGLVLVTGVTGSGKSTALAAMINHVNTNRRVNIITIEDPIEFLHRDQHSNISQREVGNDTLSFNSALRHVLRQDPDNIRDLSKQLNIPDLIAEGSIQYGMQSFDQSLFHWYSQGVISYESAIFYATNPSEFALKVSGVDSSGNRLGGADRSGIELTP